MFRVIRMMNSVGPGAMSVKKEREWERETQSEKEGEREREENNICISSPIVNKLLLNSGW